jgi:disease resistance protein RPM1
MVRRAKNPQVPYYIHFVHEINNTAALEHENAVQLVGFCHEAQSKLVNHNGQYIFVEIVETLFCYEYLPKGSLQMHLFGMYSHTPGSFCISILVPYNILYH